MYPARLFRGQVFIDVAPVLGCGAGGVEGVIPPDAGLTFVIDLVGLENSEIDKAFSKRVLSPFILIYASVEVASCAVRSLFNLVLVEFVHKSAMHILIILLFLLLLVFGPQWWASYTFRRYADVLPRIPGTGSELARHLLDRFGMSDVPVEKVEKGGDHYDPELRAVRLSHDNYDRNSLTAVAVAAHEVSHAIQHQRNEPKLALRHRLVKVAQTTQQLGAGVMFLLPVAMAITRAPSAGIIMAVIGLGSMASATLVHLVTLPVELDASFGKALPILMAGDYIQPEDEVAVRRVLRAAAFTYVASSLASLLNLARWFAFLRRA
jgi:Zn-dependent membrane protease YugP